MIVLTPQTGTIPVAPPRSGPSFMGAPKPDLGRPLRQRWATPCKQRRASKHKHKHTAGPGRSWRDHESLPLTWALQSGPQNLSRRPLSRPVCDRPRRPREGHVVPRPDALADLLCTYLHVGTLHKPQTGGTDAGALESTREGGERSQYPAALSGRQTTSPILSCAVLVLPTGPGCPVLSDPVLSSAHQPA